MVQAIAQVTLEGVSYPDFNISVNLASGITTDDLGKAVSWDSSAANTVKLAADGDLILGQLVIVEGRAQEGTLVGTVATKGGMTFPKSASTTITIGQELVGAGSGLVKGATATGHITMVEINSTTEVVGWVR